MKTVKSMSFEYNSKALCRWINVKPPSSQGHGGIERETQRVIKRRYRTMSAGGCDQPKVMWCRLTHISFSNNEHGIKSPWAKWLRALVEWWIHSINLVRNVTFRNLLWCRQNKRPIGKLLPYFAKSLGVISAKSFSHVALSSLLFTCSASNAWVPVKRFTMPSPVFLGLLLVR